VLEHSLLDPVERDHLQAWALEEIDQDRRRVRQ
jgi:hypothetical protein